MLRVKKGLLFGMMACTGICHAGVDYNTDNVNVKLSVLIDTGIPDGGISRIRLWGKVEAQESIT